MDKDLQPVAQLVSFPNLLIINPKLPAKTLPELIAYLKANEGKVNYGSSGLGTSSHLTIVMLEQAIGTKMTHVPFKSTGDVVNTMLSGNIDLAFDSMTTVWPHAEKGTVRAIAVSTPTRSSSAPDVPAIAETIKGFEATAWQGLFAPAGTPRPIVERLNREIVTALQTPAVRQQLLLIERNQQLFGHAAVGLRHDRAGYRHQQRPYVVEGQIEHRRRRQRAGA